ncbi:MAG: hypothetical protein CM1200mP29_07900 [Verrucomicrobiota bacterium]|nr:MAG: hypothetical protein CM1200mP29_07900 [Verrucomicrobiota bacterium]
MGRWSPRPGIAWWPGSIAPGQVSDEMVISLDLMPTMLDLPGPRHPRGTRLMALVCGRCCMATARLANGSFSGKAKRTATANGSSWPAKRAGCSIWEDDPGESMSLAKRHPARAKRMAAALAAWKPTSKPVPNRNRTTTPQASTNDTGRFPTPDLVVLFIYFALLIGSGFYFRKRSGTVKGFTVANRSFPVGYAGCRSSALISVATRLSVCRARRMVPIGTVLFSAFAPDRGFHRREVVCAVLPPTRRPVGV